MLLNEMELFYYVVDLKSFSKAAERLNVSKSFISKKITQLEQTLKVRLLSRSTRTLTLTEAGERFYRHCATIVQEGLDAYSMMSELQGKPTGTLKISVPPALGLNLISPLLSQFLMQYPEVNLHIELENRLVDLVEEGYDLALRSATLESSNLIAQKIFSIKNIICATEKYFYTQGVPKFPSDLETHNCAIYSSKNAKQIELIQHAHKEMVALRGNFISNQLDLIKQMVLEDVCIGILPEFMITKELQEGKLTQCLSSYQLPTSPLYAIYPERKFILPKLNCFLAMLKHYLAEK